MSRTKLLHHLPDSQKNQTNIFASQNTRNALVYLGPTELKAVMAESDTSTKPE